MGRRAQTLGDPRWRSRGGQKSGLFPFFYIFPFGGTGQSKSTYIAIVVGANGGAGAGAGGSGGAGAGAGAGAAVDATRLPRGYGSCALASRGRGLKPSLPLCDVQKVLNALDERCPVGFLDEEVVLLILRAATGAGFPNEFIQQRYTQK